MNSLFTHKV